jgi:hypothetical protein
MTTDSRDSCITVQNDAVKILRDSIDSKIISGYKKASIFDVLSNYVKSFYNNKNMNEVVEVARYDALITGSAVTHALCTSIHNNGLHPDEVGWDFNDVDIIVGSDYDNKEPVIRLFDHLYTWANSCRNVFDDKCPIEMKYSRCNTYDTGDTGTPICGVHMFTIDNLKINLIEVDSEPFFFIRDFFDLTINKVYFDGTKIDMIYPAVYRSLLTRKFTALEKTHNHSTWAVVLERVEKYRKRGFDIELSKNIKINRPNDTGILPDSRREIIKKYYNTKTTTTIVTVFNAELK